MKLAHDLEGDDLLDALGIEVEEPKIRGYTPRQERLITGFEDVLRFHEKERQGSGTRGKSRDFRTRLCRAARPARRYFPTRSSPDGCRNGRRHNKEPRW